MEVVIEIVATVCIAAIMVAVASYFIVRIWMAIKDETASI